MAINRKGQYRVTAHARAPILCSLTFDINGTSAPDGIVDDGKVLVGSGTKIVRDSAGRFTVNLADRYAKIHPLGVNLENTQDAVCKVDAVTQGYAAANKLQVATIVGGSADDPTDNSRVTVSFLAYIDR